MAHQNKKNEKQSKKNRPRPAEDARPDEESISYVEMWGSAPSPQRSLKEERSGEIHITRSYRALEDIDSSWEQVLFTGSSAGEYAIRKNISEKKTALSQAGSVQVTISQNFSQKEKNAPASRYGILRNEFEKQNKRTKEDRGWKLFINQI